MKRYEPDKIEPRWQAVWEETGLFAAPEKPKDKSYVLDMFPYPSGDGLHVGHPRGYTATDVYSHYQRYRGKEVLHPIGWDAFGLPAENAAIKKGVHPAKNTAGNIANFKRQLKRLGFSFDWNREINTSDPSYYKWTQWLFLQLQRKGLAYRGKGWQWWCPHDKTVLANEQVIDGKCERCGHEVTKKELTQWFFKITDYADELIDALDELDWPEKIKVIQRNWIGRSEGAEVTFATDAGDLTVYTTRPDTLFGATYMVLAPEHELVGKLTTKAQRQDVDDYVEQAKKESEIERTAIDKEKTGVFTGGYAVNPVNGEKLPIWIADYVLASYGTGAIMAVPAHDQRDYEFAQKFGIPVRTVVIPETGEPRENEEVRSSIVAIVENKAGELLAIDWGKKGGVLFVGGGRQPKEEAEATARREIAEETGYHELELVREAGPAINHYVSIAHGIPRVATAQLLHFRLQSDDRVETKLEEHERGMFELRWISKAEAAEKVTDPMHAHAFGVLIEDEVFTGEGVLVDSGRYDGVPSAEAREKIVDDLAKKKLAVPKTGYKLRDWLISRQRYWGCPIPVVHCPKDGAVPVPEDQLPVELPEVEDYLPTGDGRSPLAKVESFVKTTCPKCGGPAERETDTMDTFVDSSWYFLRFISPTDDKQLFDPAGIKRWLPVDMYVGGAEHAVLHLIYARFITKALADQKLLNFREPFTRLRNQGLIHAEDGDKMSKSKGNVVNPDEIIEAFGADTLRVYELFIGPFDQKAEWSTRTIEGVYRFLGRVWRFGQELAETKPALRTDTERPEIAAAGVSRALNEGIRNVTRSIEHFRFNTAVSSLMETLNEFYRYKDEASLAGTPGEWREAFESYLRLLAPFAPHIAEELWHVLGNEDSVIAGVWPAFDESAVADDVAVIVVQVNGRVRANLPVPAADLSEAAVTQGALADENVAKHLSGKKPKKVIHVEGKLINFVT